MLKKQRALTKKLKRYFPSAPREGSPDHSETRPPVSSVSQARPDLVFRPRGSPGRPALRWSRLRAASGTGLFAQHRPRSSGSAGLPAPASSSSRGCPGTRPVSGSRGAGRTGPGRPQCAASLSHRHLQPHHAQVQPLVPGHEKSARRPAAPAAQHDGALQRVRLPAARAAPGQWSPSAQGSFRGQRRRLRPQPRPSRPCHPTGVPPRPRISPKALRMARVPLQTPLAGAAPQGCRRPALSA